MKRCSLLVILVGAAVASGCGGRTSEDDLLRLSRDIDEPAAGGAGSGGRSPADGGTSSGGRMGIGGLPFPSGGSGIGGVPVPTGGFGGRSLGGNCCEPHGGRGCEVPEHAACVCSIDPYCCNISWDGDCSDLAGSPLCGASCGSTGSGGASSDGGAPGSGGVFAGGGIGSGGEAQACLDLFPVQGACSECLCSNCFREMAECLTTAECLSLFACQVGNRCECGL